MSHNTLWKLPHVARNMVAKRRSLCGHKKSGAPATASGSVLLEAPTPPQGLNCAPSLARNARLRVEFAPRSGTPPPEAVCRMPYAVVGRGRLQFAAASPLATIVACAAVPTRNDDGIAGPVPVKSACSSASVGSSAKLQSCDSESVESMESIGYRQDSEILTIRLLRCPRP